jgi:beta-galactosidase
MKKIILFSLAIFFSFSCSTPENEENASTRERISFNDNWKFQETEDVKATETNYNDSGWRVLNLPHDAAIEGEFHPDNNLRTGGLPNHGRRVYRKTFSIDSAKKDKMVTLEFDGVMSNARIYINGEEIYHRPYGYIGFEIDITPHIKFGKENTLAVETHQEVLSSRWYTGAGIYRNVWLETKNAVHVAHWGTKITTPEISNESASVNIETKVENQNDSKSDYVLQTRILDGEGKEVASASQKIDFQNKTSSVVLQELQLKNPDLWDLDSPYLYTAVSSVLKNNQEIDQYKTTFGVRSIEFSRDGFFINGRKEKIKGVCLHHDLGPLGAAVNYRATERQLQIMKNMGINAIRTSHNPTSREQLELCDKMGILVQSEAFDVWGEYKTENDYSNHWDEWHETDLRDMMRRDRNHPSIIMWSIGNEVKEQKQTSGKQIAERLVEICKEEDATRPVTAGFNQINPALKNGLAEVVDLVGVNYKPMQYAKLMQEYPNLIFYGSETASTVSSRGVYHLPLEKYDKHSSLQVSSYDVQSPPWAYPPDIEFMAQDQMPNNIGEFIWTGFDYLGEPTPYGGKDNLTHGNWNTDWPARSSFFGAVDLAGFPKDRFYFYQSQWTNEPMVHILPHWNWENSGHDEIPVFCYTNAEEAELFVNGKSLGKKVKGEDKTRIPVDFYGWGQSEKYFDSPYRLSWEVPFEAGEIEVVAYNDGKEVARKSIKTAGAPAQISLEADRSEITADGEDLSFITIDIEDENGVFHPLADNLVEFKVSGPATIAAVGNGNPSSTEPFRANYRKTFNGKCLLIIKSKKGEAGEIVIEATSEGLLSETITIQTKN